MPLFVAKESKGIKAAIHEILGFFDREIDPSRGFFLKPNIVFPVSPSSGEITRPAIVKGLIEALREKYGAVDIVIGEGTAAGTVPAENFEVSGYQGLADELDVPLVDLDQAERVQVSWKYGALDLPVLALERFYINLPILKSSSAAIFSGAIKNQKGLISPRMKKRFHHMGLHEPLAALTQAIKPGLTILDGHNFFRSENIFLAGDCVAEIDGLLMRLINSEEPHYIRMLREMGYATGEAPVHGEALPKCRPDKLRADRYKRFLNMRLWSNPRACSMCRMTLHQMKGACLHNIRSFARFYLRLLYYSIAGADLIFGSKPEYEALSRRVICIGDCTKGIAKANGYRHVPGCPPTLAQLMRYLGDE